MKRLLLCLSAIVLLSSTALGSLRPDDRDKHKHHYTTPEPGVIGILVLSIGTVAAGGLALRRKNH
jgi:hypothetical protein